MGRGRSTRWLVAVALSATLGFYFWRSDAALLRSEEPLERPRSALAARGTIERTVLATGVIRPAVGAEIDVGSRLSGTVKSLPVKVGDRVRAGQLLAELETAELDAARLEAEAGVTQSKPRVALAEGVLERRRRLAEEGLVAAEDAEIATRDLEVEIARLEAARARLRAAEIALGYARITAPIRGVIAEVSTREGETVAAGLAAPTFVTIVDLERLEVLAYVDETDIGRLTLGQAATFTVDTYRDVEFTARVNAIEPKAELRGSVVNYVARLAFEPREGYVLRPEMTAHVRFAIEKREDVVTVPRESLRRRDGRSFVKVRRGDRWLEQTVDVGWRDAGRVEIRSGLEPGEELELNPS